MLNGHADQLPLSVEIEIDILIDLGRLVIR